jgi:hypothetical protein
LQLWISTGGRLGRWSQDHRPNERRRKAGQNERAHRGGHGDSAGSVKTFRESAMPKKAPLTCETKCNLRVKRRDPWLGVNAPPKAVADPELNGQDAVDITDVSWPGLPAGGATTSRSELKSLTRNPVAETRWTALLRGRRRIVGCVSRFHRLVKQVGRQ